MSDRGYVSIDLEQKRREWSNEVRTNLIPASSFRLSSSIFSAYGFSKTKYLYETSAVSAWELAERAEGEVLAYFMTLIAPSSSCRIFARWSVYCIDSARILIDFCIDQAWTGMMSRKKAIPARALGPEEERSARQILSTRTVGRSRLASKLEKVTSHTNLKAKEDCA
jgi:hypothetical protein